MKTERFKRDKYQYKTMRLTQNKIEEITLPILGEEGLLLIKELYGKENVSEFDLAKRTKYDIKIVRKMLYLLYNNNLVGFNRKKDKEKGWYIYYWTLIPESIRFIYFKRKREQLVRLNEKMLEEEKELFFICPNDCVRLNFDQGMDFEFHCPECGELITQDTSNEANIAKIKKVIEKIEEDLKKEQRDVKRVIIKEKKKEAKKKVVKKKVVKKKTIKKKPVTKKKVTKKKPIKKKVITKKSKISGTSLRGKKKTVAKKKTVKKTIKKKVNKKKK
jgi:transcription initiation factor TFIIE subunit alpha